VDLAIDGGSVAVGGVEVFDIRRYLPAHDWEIVAGSALCRFDERKI